jgi:hypothetical protein
VKATAPMDIAAAATGASADWPSLPSTPLAIRAPGSLADSPSRSYCKVILEGVQLRG